MFKYLKKTLAEFPVDLRFFLHKFAKGILKQFVNKGTYLSGLGFFG